MKCFSHPQTSAVSTCSDCSKGLCKECCSMFDASICLQCNSVRFNREYIDAKMLLVRIGLGFGFGLAVVIMFASSSWNPWRTFLNLLWLPYILAGLCCGWRMFAQGERSSNVVIVAGSDVHVWSMIAQTIASTFVGSVTLPIVLYQTIKKFKVINSQMDLIGELLNPGLIRLSSREFEVKSTV